MEEAQINKDESTECDKLIELKTVQTNSFKNLFESLKEILTFDPL